ncbi:ABC transporter ATP-binding protein [Candidatus Dojkabacteria bacterium]|uniref:ABC transporter ATP-binding protein n=1 Tax=Candidatus Dojkabacteria bacterium TaxID=2099670 RepID=A0A3M0Z4R0_9BACT|nr:MAG: ABC transporter ATP-binding protein [Candidatus Dojkabacteria bacterium]
MKNNSYKPKKSFVHFLAPHAGWILLITITNLISNGISLVIPRFTANLINEVKISGSIDTNFTLTWFFSALALILILSIMQILIASISSENIAATLRKKIIKKISQQDTSFVDQKTSSKLLTNLTSDIDFIKTFVSQGFSSLVSTVFLALGASFSLLLIDANLALIVILSIPLMMLTFILIFKKLMKLFKNSQEVIDKLNLKISETIFGANLVRVLSSQEFEKEKFNKLTNTSREISIKIVNNFGMLLPIINLIFNTVLVLVIYFGGINVIENSLSLGEFQAFYQYTGLLLAPIFILGFVGGTISRAFSSYSRIAEVLESSDSTINSDNKMLIDIKGNFEIRDLNFSVGEKQILKKIKLKIHTGQKVAIIGPTAAGKTALVNTILGLNKNFTGDILLEGISILNIEEESIYKQIGVVFQDSLIFNSSIRENITLGDCFSDDEIMKVIKIACLDDLVRSEIDLEKIISERGGSLSGGQKQRLTLARALVRKPKVLILDDITARVDIGTEKKIIKNIFEDFADATLIFITQKVELIKNFDNIIFLMEGEILGEGKHEELLNRCFEYRQIYESQRNVEYQLLDGYPS